VGLFSFLTKKNAQPPARPAARPRPDLSSPLASSPLASEAERERQREIARATAAKIDAIELEMTTDMFADTEAAWGSARRVPAAASVAEVPLDAELATLIDLPDAAAAPASAPVVEESAILYANGQADLAEQMLLASLAELGRSERQPWWMLFDLYQAQGRESAFENIAIDYASQFETSPPTYTQRLTQDLPATAWTGVAPGLRFPGMLDAGAAPRLQGLAAAGGAPLRLDFTAVTGASPEGCAALLSALQGLRASGREVVLAGAEVLIGVLRPMLAIGERAGGEAPWLLLLELLQRLQREKDFEETAMDYCVSFEVSPPSYEAGELAPARTGLAAAGATDPAAEQRFVLPAVVDGDVGPLLAALEAYAAADSLQPLVLDCARLARIGFGAAGALHAALCRLAGSGRSVELRELNHVVAALLRLLNYSDCARLYAHKY
jgi:anti-anti-sigma regulatory factor